MWRRPPVGSNVNYSAEDLAELSEEREFWLEYSARAGWRRARGGAETGVISLQSNVPSTARERFDRSPRRASGSIVQGVELPERGEVQGGFGKARPGRARRICEAVGERAGQQTAFRTPSALHGQSGRAARRRTVGRRRDRLFRARPQRRARRSTFCSCRTYSADSSLPWLSGARKRWSRLLYVCCGTQSASRTS